MRICIVGKFPPIEGGVSHQTHLAAHELARRGHDVAVVTNAAQVEPELRALMLPGDSERLEALRAAPAAVAKQIDRTLPVADELARYGDAESGSVVTRGVNYGTAFEIALKIRELSGAPFEAFSSADLLHGPIAALKPGRPAIVIAPSGRTLESMRGAIEKIRERGAELIAISDDADFLASAQTAFPLVPDLPEWLSPLLTVVPGQVAAVELAKLQGADIDAPVGLTSCSATNQSVSGPSVAANRCTCGMPARTRASVTRAPV